MGDLSRNFSRHEFACNCGCGLDTVDIETLDVLQDCCEYFSAFLAVDRVTAVVNSGCRCEGYNNQVGGSKNSQHVKCRAVDFRIVGVLPINVHKYLDQKYPGKYGIGSYSTFTHVDTRSGGPARWVG